MKKSILLLFLLGSFATMIGQTHFSGGTRSVRDTLEDGTIVHKFYNVKDDGSLEIFTLPDSYIQSSGERNGEYYIPGRPLNIYGFDSTRVFPKGLNYSKTSTKEDPEDPSELVRSYRPFVNAGRFAVSTGDGSINTGLSGEIGLIFGFNREEEPDFGYHFYTVGGYASYYNPEDREPIRNYRFGFGVGVNNNRDIYAGLGIDYLEALEKRTDKSFFGLNLNFRIAPDLGGDISPFVGGQLGYNFKALYANGSIGIIYKGLTVGGKKRP